MNTNELKENDVENPENSTSENIQNKLLNIQMKKLIMLEYERDKKYNFIEVIQKLISASTSLVREKMVIMNSIW